MQFRHTAKVFVLSSKNISKYGFLTGKDVFTTKSCCRLEKVATVKRFEYSPLRK